MPYRILLSLALATGLAAAPPAFIKEGKGPAILLIHGFGGSREVWKDIAPALAKDHTVVRVDLPGSGGSPGPALVEGAADFEALAADLAALVRWEHLEPCLIVGHSMGGPLAALAVLKDPAAFRGLALVDSFLGSIPAAYFDATLAALDVNPKEALAAFFSRMASGPEQKERLAQEGLAVPVPVLKAYLRGMSRDSLKGRQGALTLPVIQFEAGPEEPDAAKREASRTFAGFKALKNFRVVAFPKAHHWVMWDEPGAFLEALRGFEKGLHPDPAMGAK